MLELALDELKVDDVLDGDVTDDKDELSELERSGHVRVREEGALGLDAVLSLDRRGLHLHLGIFTLDRRILRFLLLRLLRLRVLDGKLGQPLRDLVACVDGN